MMRILCGIFSSLKISFTSSTFSTYIYVNEKYFLFWILISHSLLFIFIEPRTSMLVDSLRQRQMKERFHFRNVDVKLFFLEKLLIWLSLENHICRIFYFLTLELFQLFNQTYLFLQTKLWLISRFMVTQSYHDNYQMWFMIHSSADSFSSIVKIQLGFTVDIMFCKLKGPRAKKILKYFKRI